MALVKSRGNVLDFKFKKERKRFDNGNGGDVVVVTTMVWQRWQYGYGSNGGVAVAKRESRNRD